MYAKTTELCVNTYQRLKCLLVVCEPLRVTEQQMGQKHRKGPRNLDPTIQNTQHNR